MAFECTEDMCSVNERSSESIIPKSLIEETNLIICPTIVRLRYSYKLDGFFRLVNDTTAHLSMFIFDFFIIGKYTNLKNLTKSDCSIFWSLTELILIYIFKSSANSVNVQHFNIRLTSYINNQKSKGDDKCPPCGTTGSVVKGDEILLETITCFVLSVR